MTEDKILWTAQYVEGDLSDSERLEFESLLVHDQELKQYLADYYDIHSSLQMELANDVGRAALVETLRSLNTEHFEEAASPKVLKLNHRLKWISAVAAVLVLGMLVWAPWNDDLYQQFNGAPQMSVAERGAEKTDLDEAAALFNDKKYADAKVVLAKLHVADTRNAMISYYYAVALVETGEVAKGRLLLEELFNGQSVYKYDAVYALAMSYLKEENRTACKFWLEKISKDAAPYQKAQELLGKL